MLLGLSVVEASAQIRISILCLSHKRRQGLYINLMFVRLLIMHLAINAGQPGKSSLNGSGPLLATFDHKLINLEISSAAVGPC